MSELTDASDKNIGLRPPDLGDVLVVITQCIEHRLTLEDAYVIVAQLGSRLPTHVSTYRRIIDSLVDDRIHSRDRRSHGQDRPEMVSDRNPEGPKERATRMARIRRRRARDVPRGTTSDIADNR